MKNRLLQYFLLFISILSYQVILAQPEKKYNLDYSTPREYTIGGITVTGAQFLDPDALVAYAGLKVGDRITIPGDAISNAIKKIWEQGLVGDVNISITKIEGDFVFLEIFLRERPRLSKFVFEGVKRTEKEDIIEKIDYALGQKLTDAMKQNFKKKVQNYFVEKGYLNVEVKDPVPVKDSLLPNSIILKFVVNKKEKVKIDEIVFIGNDSVADNKLKKRMKKTKEKKTYKFFTNSKLVKKEYENDKNAIIEYYNSLGFRDAKIVTDSIVPVAEDRVKVYISVDEGIKYYFRNITWTGNYKYSDGFLDTILGIRTSTFGNSVELRSNQKNKKGLTSGYEPYNYDKLQRKLNFNPNGLDISSLYLDDGYLFFSVDPVEVMVDGPYIDIEMRIYEGPQATINNVTISGNTKTHDHVILREIRTLPGQKFSRADLIRSQREIAALGYFDPEKIQINPMPNPENGTVDIHYTVEEKPSDQVELSGGWGGYFGFVGTLGLVFNNFSMKNVVKPKTWNPLPAGDGQRFAIRFQANGKSYQTYSLSFTEPWLGGRKPQAFTVSLSRSVQNLYDPVTQKYNNNRGLQVSGVTVTLGKRLKWPDDYFTLSHSVSLMHYDLHNYTSTFGLGSAFANGNASANNFSFTNTIARSNIDDFTFPTGGSSQTLSISLTPPYSVFNNKCYACLEEKERYKYIEFHKWMFDNTWFTTLIPGKKRSLVLNTRAHFGYIGYYKKATGIGPFERFIMGGSGITGFNFLLGSEIIALRGYDNNVIRGGDRNGPGGTVYNKFVAEIRYPISMSPAFSIFVLGFVEGGNTWSNFKDYNPFSLYRAAGIGTRIFMPAFGLVGIDWGYPLDPIPGMGRNTNGMFTFTIGQQLR